MPPSRELRPKESKGARTGKTVEYANEVIFRIVRRACHVEIRENLPRNCCRTKRSLVPRPEKQGK